MNSKGQNMTINKLVMIISAIVFLALAIPMYTSGTLNPLFERAEGFGNEILLLIGRIGNSAEAPSSECKQKFYENVIPNVDGVVECCKDIRSFKIKKPEEFLGYESFSLTADGYKAQKFNSERLESKNSFGFKVEDSLRHREVYQELKEIFDNFYLKKGEGENRKEFFAPMEFNARALLQITVIEGASNRVFDWNGEKWIVTFGNFLPRDVDDSEVFESVYDSYKYGFNVYWNFLGDKTRNTVIENFNTNFRFEKYSEDEFLFWLNERMNEVDLANRDNFGFSVEIEDSWRNTKYFYKNNEWKKDGLLFFNSDANITEVLDSLILANENSQEITWKDNDEKVEKVVITDKEIISRSDKVAEIKLRNWINKTRDNWTDNKESQDKFLEEFSEYLGEETFVNIEGREFLVKLAWGSTEDRSRIFVYFDIGAEKKFGMYTEGDELVLTYGRGMDKSIVNEEVEFNENNWGEFLKINSIFEYLIEKC
jgi:hypothetical protein